MSRKLHSPSKQLMVAAALALGASSVALADDSSMSPFSGESYKYFNGQSNRTLLANAPAAPSWRQSHPNGLTEAELQAASASGLSTFWAQLDTPVLASAPADPSWRQSHPNGLTEHELEAWSSSALAVWQRPSGSERMASASTGQPDVAQNTSKSTFSGRLARLFHAENGAPTRAAW
jgi:hypothetical protein